MAPIFCAYSSIIFYSRASTYFWSANYMVIILLKSATTNVFPSFAKVVPKSSPSRVIAFDIAVVAQKVKFVN